MGVKSCISDEDSEEPDTYLYKEARRDGKKRGRCFKSMRIICTRLYPKEKRVVKTPQSQWLRKMALIGMCTHFSLFVLCLFFVGFFPMISNLIFALWCWSIYLCLIHRVIVYYIIFLKLDTLRKLFLGFGSEEQNEEQKIGLIFNCMIWIALNWFLTGAYYQFFRSGGITGFAAERSSFERYLALFEEKLAD